MKKLIFILSVFLITSCATQRDSAKTYSKFQPFDHIVLNEVEKAAAEADASGNIFINGAEVERLLTGQTVRVYGYIKMTRPQARSDGQTLSLGGQALIFENGQLGTIVQTYYNNGRPMYLVSFDDTDPNGVNGIWFHTQSDGSVWANIPREGRYFQHAGTTFFIDDNKSGLSLGLNVGDLQKREIQYDDNDNIKNEDVIGKTTFE